MNQTHTIVIGLPPASVKPHNSGSWRSKHLAVKDYRESAHQALLVKHRALIHQGAIPFKVRIHHEWFLAKTQIEAKLKKDCPVEWKKYRPADEQNAIHALKPVIDGIVDAGVLTDDSYQFVEWGRYVPHRRQFEHQGRHCVILTLEILADHPIQPRPRKKK